MLDPREESIRWIYVVDFFKDSAVLRVKDFVNNSTYIHLGIS